MKCRKSQAFLHTLFAMYSNTPTGLQELLQIRFSIQRSKIEHDTHSVSRLEFLRHCNKGGVHTAQCMLGREPSKRTSQNKDLATLYQCPMLVDVLHMLL